LPTILHTADVHLGRAWKGYAPVADRLRELQWESLETICRLAAERGAVALVIAGDLFERPDPPRALVDRVSGLFKRLSKQGVGVVIAPGTHDAAGAPQSVYRTGDLGGARVFLRPRLGESFLLERGGEAVSFSGLAWDPQGTPADYLDEYRPGHEGVPDVLVLHAQVGAMSGKRPKDLPAEPVRLAASGASYVALGHRHRHREFREAGSLWGAYPGTPFGLSFNAPELGPRSASLISLDGPLEPRISVLPAGETEWQVHGLDLGDICSQEELLAAARELVSDAHLVRLNLTGVADFTPDISDLRGALAGESLYLELEDSSLELAPGALEPLSEEHSVRGIFARRMLERLGDAGSADERVEIAAAIREGLGALAAED